MIAIDELAFCSKRSNGLNVSERFFGERVGLLVLLHGQFAPTTHFHSEIVSKVHNDGSTDDREYRELPALGRNESTVSTRKRNR